VTCSLKKVVIKCGHCVSACDGGAIKHYKLNSDAVCKVGGIPKSEEMLNLILSRRSTRKFKDKKIDKEDWDKLIKSVQYSMTGCNVQEVNLVIIESKDIIEKISNIMMDFMVAMEEQIADPKLTSQFEPSLGKPIMDAISKYGKSTYIQKEAKKRGHDFALFDCPALMLFTGVNAALTSIDATLATQSVALMAPTLGIGACNSGFLPIIFNAKYPPFMDIIKDIIPEGHGIFSALALGYETFQYSYIPERKERTVSFY
jgi:nitroreductase